jgi:threonine/homoserine/homoserine lactone efflux protein
MELLLAGFILSIFGSIPPGLISITVAHTAIRRGLAAALLLALGAAVSEFFQAWAAVLLTDWFLSHPAIERAFQGVAIVVFFFLGFYLLFYTPSPKAPTEGPKIVLANHFLKGLVISVFNLLAIPYWFVYCGWLKVEGWWQEGLASTLLFSFGVMLGTIFSLALYAWLGLLIVHHASNIARQANRLVGLIFLGLGLKLLIGLF